MIKKQKFALMVPWMDLGGADRCGLDLVRYFKERDWETAVFATQHDDTQRTKRHEFEAVADAVHGGAFWQNELSKFQPDIILINNCIDAYDNLETIKDRCPNSKIVCLHHMLLPDPWDFEKHFDRPEIDLVLTVSERLMGALNQMSDFTDIRTLHWFGFRPEVRKQIDLNKSRSYILCPMRIADQKRPLFIIDIAKSLAGMGYHPEFRIVGDGPMRGAFEKAVRFEGLTKQITFHEPRDFDEMMPLYERAIALLNPSVDEGIPLTYYEAMEADVPLAVSDVGGVAELPPPQYMVTVPDVVPNEARMYAEILAHCIDNTDHITEAKIEAHDILTKNFLYENWATKLDSIVDELCPVPEPVGFPALIESRKKFIVHIGLGKTGTSSIQAALADYPGDLGVWPSGISYGYMAAHCGGWKVDTLRHMIRCSSENTVTWCNETIVQEPDTMIPIIDELQEWFDVEVYCYLRDKHDWLKSAYKQWGIAHKIRAGRILSFEKWCRYFGDAMYHKADIWFDRYDGKIQFLDYCDDVVADFSQRIGIPLETRRENESYEPHELVSRAIFNECFPGSVHTNPFDDIAVTETLEELCDRLNIPQLVTGRETLIDQAIIFSIKAMAEIEQLRRKIER